MEREGWKEHNNGYYDPILFDCDRDVPIRERSPALSSSPSRLGYIEHHVTKFDTLAGIAIKYGVEVADIRKMNGLVTDRQMFGLKTLHIPLPGRHSPSPGLSNGSCTSRDGNSDQCTPDHVNRELFETFQSLRIKSSNRKVSPAMSSLQGYYGLKGPSENGLPITSRPLSHHRKSKSLVNVILEEIMEKDNTVPAAEAWEDNSDKFNGKLFKRRQKSEADFTRIPEMLLKQDNSGSGGHPSRTGEGLALRIKAASRTAVTTDSESIGSNPPIGAADGFPAEGLCSVRKSSSTSCLLQDQDNNGSSSIWPTSMWSLKPDLQALSTAAIGKPIFDGLPKPITSRRNKAALD